MKKMNISLAFGSILAATFLTVSMPALIHVANADTSTSEKIQNDLEDTKNDAKSTVRKVKRKVRDATGHGSAKKDFQDKVEDVKDDISTEAKKLDRKHK